jgi:hypothetical protein
MQPSSVSDRSGSLGEGTRTNPSVGWLPRRTVGW